MAEESWINEDEAFAPRPRVICGLDNPRFNPKMTWYKQEPLFLNGHKNDATLGCSMQTEKGVLMAQWFFQADWSIELLESVLDSISS